MNNYRSAAWRIFAALGVTFFMVCLLLCERTGAVNLYREALEFDSDGNLQMTTHDKKATSGTKYRTIGWTIKRYQGSVTAKERARIKLRQTSSYADPNDSNYVYTSFVCDKYDIFGRIGAASKAWRKELYQNGGVVYLDAIMTVVVDGKALGSMDADGTLHGEVYTTAEGIMNARGWADPSGLLTHFNKAVYFPPDPDMVETPEETADKDTLRLAYGEEECEENSVAIRGADTFDAEQAIPTGEYLTATGALQKYYYKCVLTHYYGTMNVPVQLDVTYTYTYQQGKETVTDTITTPVTVYVQRSYSYYRIKSLKLYALESVRIENGALPSDVIEVDPQYTINVNLVRNQDEYVKIPAVSGSLQGGDLSSGGSLSSEQLQSYAESLVGELKVRNDRLWIDGEKILKNAYADGSAPEPLIQTGLRQQQVTTEQLLIPHTKRNATYQTDAWATYKNVYDSDSEEMSIGQTNDVTVHTPVVCKGGITDDIAHNQQVEPTQYLSLILGRPFTTGISTYGTHRSSPGYGTRDYAKYVIARQVRFPFPVYLGNTYYEKNTWIEMGSSSTFTLPVGVDEGDYRIYYRTIAANVGASPGGTDQTGYLANLELSQYIAYDSLMVTVVGRMYDLAITDLVDYPRWKSVFYESDGTKKENYFWIGRRNADGEVVASRQSSGIFPVLYGDHPYNPTAHALGLGYRVKLRLKTTGDMYGDEAQVIGFPTFYYISSDGFTRKQVRLYEKDGLTELAPKLVFSSEDRKFVGIYEKNVQDLSVCGRSLQVWDSEYQLPADVRIVDADVDLDAYIQAHGGRISQRAPIFYRDGYLLVRFELHSYRDQADTGHLAYCNVSNASSGYCDMWKLQGYTYTRTDGLGNSFSFLDGDCLLFDIRRNLHTDYESWGTH